MGRDSLETLWQAIHGRRRKKKVKNKGDVFARSSTGMGN